MANTVPVLLPWSLGPGDEAWIARHVSVTLSPCQSFMCNARHDEVSKVSVRVPSSYAKVCTSGFINGEPLFPLLGAIYTAHSSDVTTLGSQTEGVLG
ncbi:colanic acid biosynthesis acetyltransferase WcaF [Babesia caballi]|uniref:Colanic acid biosynthesis acetyltransferase WcaF n=1 Tax=Babesia caballi TaxID=5871 RepID=A0AAV4LPE2_BABCB|nr:colanic acid biosynthesis acetyltransferase WcaF [Babesia caballi]